MNQNDIPLSENSRKYLDTAVFAAMEAGFIPSQIKDTIYTREEPVRYLPQNGLHWNPQTETLRRIGTSPVRKAVYLVGTDEPGGEEERLYGWYLIETHYSVYLVYFSPQNPEYIPLRPDAVFVQ